MTPDLRALREKIERAVMEVRVMVNCRRAKALPCDCRSDGETGLAILEEVLALLDGPPVPRLEKPVNEGGAHATECASTLTPAGRACDCQPTAPRKNFSELRAQMSPESQARMAERAAGLLGNTLTVSDTPHPQLPADDYLVQLHCEHEFVTHLIQMPEGYVYGDLDVRVKMQPKIVEVVRPVLQPPASPEALTPRDD